MRGLLPAQALLVTLFTSSVSLAQGGGVQAPASPAVPVTAPGLGGLTQEQRKAQQIIYLNYVTEPDTMDVNRMVAAPSYLWLGHIYEGLMTTDAKGRLVPGQAERMEVSADGRTYTFTLRKDAKWHDGTSVRAEDFVTSWRRLVDPVYASDYAFIAETAQIRNAGDIIRKKKPKESLGVEAKGDATLVVTLENPVPFFPSLMAFQTFFPVRRDILDKHGDKFATEVDSLVGNGPFRLTSWQHDKGLRLEKAPGYWNAKAIKLNAIEAPLAVTDKLSEFNVYRTGGLDLINLAENSFKEATRSKYRPKSMPDGSVTYFEFNTRPGRLFSDRRLREAVRVGISRRDFISKIAGMPGDTPAYGIVPDVMQGATAGRSFRKDFPLKPADAEAARAKKLVQDYLAEKKLERLPTLTYLAGDSPNAKRYSEYFQQRFQTLLGAEVKVDSIAYKARSQRQRDGEFDITMYGWVADYADPLSYVDLFAFGSGSNHTGWSSPEYDGWISNARTTNDNAERMKLFAMAEDFLVIKESVIAPIVQNSKQWLEAQGLTGVVRTTVGTWDPDFRFASWGGAQAKK